MILIIYSVWRAKKLRFYVMEMWVDIQTKSYHCISSQKISLNCCPLLWLGNCGRLGSYWFHDNYCIKKVALTSDKITTLNGWYMDYSRNRTWEVRFVLINYKSNVCFYWIILFWNQSCSIFYNLTHQLYLRFDLWYAKTKTK